MVDVALIARFALALLFVVSSVHKLAQHVEFESALAGYGLRSALTIRFVGGAIAMAEAAAAIGLAVGFKLPELGYAVAAMLICFSGASAVKLLQGKQIECGCFGPGRKLTWSAVLRNLAFVAAAIAIATDSRSPASFHAAVPFALGGVLLAIAWLLAEAAAEVLRRSAALATTIAD